jgi:hypothetical protein
MVVGAIHELPLPLFFSTIEYNKKEFISEGDIIGLGTIRLRAKTRHIDR